MKTNTIVVLAWLGLVAIMIWLLYRLELDLSH